jgi:hypothetical protein
MTMDVARVFRIQTMNNIKSTARLAGFLYVLVALLAPFVLLYVPGQLYVSGDSSATVERISANQDLFMAAILVGLVSELLFVTVILLLYRLLRGVDGTLAVLMVALIMLQVPLAFLGIANEVATLQFIRGGDFLDVFTAPQRDALAMLMINVDRQGVLVSQVFWGLWLLPLGLLIFQSRFVPRVLGIWLVLNGLAYVTLSVIGLVAPEYRTTAFNFATPLMFGELALALWLLIMGVRTVSTPIPASRT